jgi:hypothetical protein
MHKSVLVTAEAVGDLLVEVERIVAGGDGSRTGAVAAIRHLRLLGRDAEAAQVNARTGQVCNGSLVSYGNEPEMRQIGKFLGLVDCGDSINEAARGAGLYNTKRIRVLWALGRLGHGGRYAALSGELDRRAARAANVVIQTPQQATLEAVARVPAADDSAARVQRRVADLDALAALAVEPVSIPERVKPDGDGWMGRDEVCDALNCSPRTLARKVEAGEVERLQDGRNGLYRVRGASTSQDAATSAPPPAPVLWDVSVKVLGGGVMDLRGASMTINSGGIEISSGGIMVAATLDVLDALNFKRQGGT